MFIIYSFVIKKSLLSVFDIHTQPLDITKQHCYLQSSYLRMIQLVTTTINHKNPNFSNFCLKEVYCSVLGCIIAILGCICLVSCEQDTPENLWRNYNIR